VRLDAIERDVALEALDELRPAVFARGAGVLARLSTSCRLRS
jgi:hypothetical protein